MGTESLPLTVTLLSNPLSLSLARESTSSGTECNGEALALDISGTDASGDAKAETAKAVTDDCGNDGLLQSVEPAKQRASTTLQQSSGCRQSTEGDVVHELGELRKSTRGVRTVEVAGMGEGGEIVEVHT